MHRYNYSTDEINRMVPFELEHFIQRHYQIEEEKQKKMEEARQKARNK